MYLTCAQYEALPRNLVSIKLQKKVSLLKKIFKIIKILACKEKKVGDYTECVPLYLKDELTKAQYKYCTRRIYGKYTVRHS